MTYIAFDIDGTIFDCNDIIIDAFQLGIAIFNKQSSMDIALPNKDIIMSMIGMPTDIIFKRLFPELGAHHLKRVVDYCTQGLAQIICEGGGGTL